MISSAEPLVLGIESSCDETGIGIVRGDTLLANVISSSLEAHVRFGGVIPENASRAHLDAVIPSLERALAQAGAILADVDVFAVTGGPGLAGALMVGVSAAKTLSVAVGKPLYAVNHLVAHVGAGLLDAGEGRAPIKGEKEFAALLVSGGHTEILKVGDIAGDVRLLGATLDDAAGEAYDKVARLLGLDYPGGPAIEALAKEGDPCAVSFPRALTQPRQMKPAGEGGNRYDFSFSGLKTAVSRYLHMQRDRGGRVGKADVAASFQEAVVDVLSMKAVLACRDYGLQTLLVGGGVASNRRLRQVLWERTAVAGIELVIPEFSLCTDNGAMVAALASRLVQAGAGPSALDFSVRPGLSATVVQQR